MGRLWGGADMQMSITIKGAFELAQNAPMVEQAAEIGTEGAMMRKGCGRGLARGEG